MVTGLLLLLLPRFIAVVMGAEMVTGVAEAELQTSLPSKRSKKQNESSNFVIQQLKLAVQEVKRYLMRLTLITPNAISCNMILTDPKILEYLC